MPDTLYILKLINEAQVFAVMAVNERHAMMRMDDHLGHMRGTLTEADVEVYNVSALERELKKRNVSVLKLVEL